MTTEPTPRDAVRDRRAIQPPHTDLRTMIILQIEHPISDFHAWRRTFDDDPAARAQSGVRRYRVLRPLNDPHYVLTELEFDSVREAEVFLARQRQLWRVDDAHPGERPQARLVEVLDSQGY